MTIIRSDYVIFLWKFSLCSLATSLSLCHLNILLANPHFKLFGFTCVLLFLTPLVSNQRFQMGFERQEKKLFTVHWLLRHFNVIRYSDDDSAIMWPVKEHYKCLIYNFLLWPHPPLHWCSQTLTDKTFTFAVH